VTFTPAVEFTPSANTAAVLTEALSVSKVFVVRAPTEFPGGWYNAGARHYVEWPGVIKRARGQKTFAKRGHIFPEEDSTEIGHTFPVPSKDNWVALFVDCVSNSRVTQNTALVIRHVMADDERGPRFPST
jgi:hypothetical protein